MSGIAEFSANFSNPSDFGKPTYEYQPVEGPIDFLNPSKAPLFFMGVLT